MVINGQTLLSLAPIKNMIRTKESNGHTSYGLSEAGYDIRLKQDIIFQPYWQRNNSPAYPPQAIILVNNDRFAGRFTLASAIEEFQMPTNLVGIVHDKSTWARQGLSVFNTVIEPGWNGFLTLELVYHGNTDLHIPAGSGIAQVIFHETAETASYGDGKYQNQEDRPVESRFR